MVSTSTDGRLLWWDLKKLGEGPTEQLVLYESNPNAEKPNPKILGGTCPEYNADASPMKYLIGTEQGGLMQATRKKDKVEINYRYGFEQGRHHGPVYSL